MLLRNILLIVGFVALLGGAALVVLWISAAPAADVAATEDKVARQSILIATHPIGAGTLLRAEDVTWKEVAASDVTAANLVGSKGVETAYIGAVARRDFGEGEALVNAGIVKQNERGFLAAVLAPGMRAVSIAVDAPQSASGLILPGDHVDVILTQSIQNGTPVNDTVGETVLRDLRVIAVDQLLSTASKPASAVTTSIVGGSTPPMPKTVTLEATEQQAEKLFVAGALGKLDLAVRSLEEPVHSSSHVEAINQPTWGSDVSKALRNLRQAPPRPAQDAAVNPAQGARQPTRTQVEVMHGAKTEAR